MIEVVVDGGCWWNDRGFGRFTRELMGALLARRGARYHLVLPHPRPAGCRVAAPPQGLSVSVASPAPPTRPDAEARSPRRLLAMARALSAQRSDLVFFPSLSTWVPVRGRSVVTVHDAIPERHPRAVFAHRGQEVAWRIKSALARRRATRLLTVSRAAAVDLIELLGADPLRLDVTTEAAHPRFHPRRTAAPAVLGRCGVAGRPFFLYVGGFTPHKNTLALLRAFALVPGSPGLVLAGATSRSGFHDELPAIEAWLAAHPEVAARVALPGWLADDDLVDLYTHARALVFVSLAEGFGLPAVEAMACGCPVIASNRTSLPEVVGPGGLLVDPEDVGAIAGAMQRLLADPDLARSLSRSGVEQASSFTWQAAAASTERCLLAAAG